MLNAEEIDEYVAEIEREKEEEAEKKKQKKWLLLKWFSLNIYWNVNQCKFSKFPIQF